MNPIVELCAKVCEEHRQAAEACGASDYAMAYEFIAERIRALPPSEIEAAGGAVTGKCVAPPCKCNASNRSVCAYWHPSYATPALDEPTRQLCIQACEEVAKRIPHGALDCIAAIKAIPATELATCICGEPTTLGVVHRTDGPCFVYEAPAALPKKHTPFDNCRYQVCDLPGQCVAEGACHHPVTPAALPDKAGGAVAWIPKYECKQCGEIVCCQRAAPAALPEGYVLVPMEPIEEMAMAVYGSLQSSGTDGWKYLATHQREKYVRAAKALLAASSEERKP